MVVPHTGVAEPDVKITLIMIQPGAVQHHLSIFMLVVQGALMVCPFAVNRH